jgi:hypothetical protein
MNNELNKYVANLTPQQRKGGFKPFGWMLVVVANVIAQFYIRGIIDAKTVGKMLNTFSPTSWFKMLPTFVMVVRSENNAGVLMSDFKTILRQLPHYSHGRWFGLTPTLWEALVKENREASSGNFAKLFDGEIGMDKLSNLERDVVNSFIGARLRTLKAKSPNADEEYLYQQACDFTKESQIKPIQVSVKAVNFDTEGKMTLDSVRVNNLQAYAKEHIGWKALRTLEGAENIREDGRAWTNKENMLVIPKVQELAERLNKKVKSTSKPAKHETDSLEVTITNRALDAQYLDEKGVLKLNVEHPFGEDLEIVAKVFIFDAFSENLYSVDFDITYKGEKIGRESRYESWYAFTKPLEVSMETRKNWNSPVSHETVRLRGIEFNGSLLGMFRNLLWKELGEDVISPNQNGGNASATITYANETSSANHMDVEFGMDRELVNTVKNAIKTNENDYSLDLKLDMHHHYFGLADLLDFVSKQNAVTITTTQQYVMSVGKGKYKLMIDPKYNTYYPIIQKVIKSGFMANYLSSYNKLIDKEPLSRMKMLRYRGNDSKISKIHLNDDKKGRYKMWECLADKSSPIETGLDENGNLVIGQNVVQYTKCGHETPWGTIFRCTENCGKVNRFNDMKIAPTSMLIRDLKLGNSVVIGPNGLERIKKAEYQSVRNDGVGEMLSSGHDEKYAKLKNGNLPKKKKKLPTQRGKPDLTGKTQKVGN